MEQNQPQETTSVKQPSPDEGSHHPVKVERKEEDVTPKSETAQVGAKEEPTEPDSEEPAGPEEQEELRRRMDAFPFAPSSDSTPRQSEATRGPTGLRTPREPTGPYAPRRSTGPYVRGISPDQFLFHQTIWMEHDRSAAAHEDPVTQIRQELFTMQANLETLRTRIGQVADLRDAQGLREGQHMLATRLTEVEECISVHNVREFMRRIMRIETQIGNTGGVIGETIRIVL